MYRGYSPRSAINESKPELRGVADDSRRLGQTAAFLGQQLEIHHYGRIDFDRIAIQKRWTVAPLADRFDSGTRQFGVNLRVDHTQRQRVTLHSDNCMEYDGPLDARGPGCLRIDRLYFV